MGYDWVLRYYFVAFIDVLDQSRKLLKLDRLPVNEDEQTAAALILHGTAGNIMSLREGFSNFFDARKKSTDILDALPEDKRVIAERLRRAEVTMTNFSDTIVMTIPLSNDDEHCLSISSIYSALYGICGIFLVALAQQQPFRCGADIGLGVELPTATHEVYGPALVKAYYLENEVALYPRIVIGDSLFGYLNMVQQVKSDTIEAKLARKWAGDCKALTTLDFIGEGVKSIPEGIDKPLVEKAYGYVVGSHDSFTKLGDLKLRQRYGLLRSYFESKLHLWNIQTIPS